MNLYFLFIAILQLFPSITPVNPITSWYDRPTVTVFGSDYWSLGSLWHSFSHWLPQKKLPTIISDTKRIRKLTNGRTMSFVTVSKCQSSRKTSQSVIWSLWRITMRPRVTWWFWRHLTRLERATSRYSIKLHNSPTCCSLRLLRRRILTVKQITSHAKLWCALRIWPTKSCTALKWVVFKLVARHKCSPLW